MTNGFVRALARSTGLIVITFGACLSSVFAGEQDLLDSDAPELISRPTGQPLTDFETMELHLRRYNAAANQMAQIFMQLDQKIQEVSLAAKTAESRSNSHNRRQLEEKLRHLESARRSLIMQHAQLQSQLQNEYRNYLALSASLRARHDALQDLQTKVDAARAAKEAGEAKEEKEAVPGSSKGGQSGTRRDKSSKPHAEREAMANRAKNPNSISGPTLHPIPEPYTIRGFRDRFRA
ncbi:MAG: hypothetical protein H0X43_02425 [Nitrosospira sp.]|nr:hypothetical protein [Nitrosospira sp.]